MSCGATGVFKWSHLCKRMQVDLEQRCGEDKLCLWARLIWAKLCVMRRDPDALIACADCKGLPPLNRFDSVRHASSAVYAEYIHNTLFGIDAWCPVLPDFFI
jgi:hypothetical protein